MSVTMVVLVTLAGLYVGGNIGANDSGNCVGASVGAGLIRYRTAIILVAIFVIAGALLQGGEVTKTLGKGIVTDPIGPLGVLSALVCGGIFVTLATVFKIPVSTSQSVVGAVAGVGVASNLTVAWAKVGNIVLCWLLCPFLTMVVTYVLYRLTLWAMRKIQKDVAIGRLLTVLVLISAGYAAFSLGANNLGNAIGPIVSMESAAIDTRYLIVAGAVSIAVGALIFGKGVCETVGKNIIPLDLPSAFSVQTASAFGLHLFSMVGIPVSTSQAIVGALMGIGVYHGSKTVSHKKLATIAIGWVVVPTGAGFVAFVIFLLVNRFFA